MRVKMMVMIMMMNCNSKFLWFCSQSFLAALEVKTLKDHDALATSSCEKCVCVCVCVCACVYKYNNKYYLSLFFCFYSPIISLYTGNEKCLLSHIASVPIYIYATIIKSISK